MTRPRGTVPVQLTTTEAERLSRWLSEYVPPAPALTSMAFGVTATTYADAVLTLAAALAPRTGRGRPRAGLSTFHLPRVDLKVLDNGYTALAVPVALRPALKKALRPLRATKGPKLPAKDRAANRARAEGETARRYRYEDRIAAQRRAEARRAVEALPPVTMTKETRAVWGAIIAHQRLI